MFKRFLSRKEQEQVEEERKEMEISLPTNFQRGVHIEHDAANNTYKGIPTAWRDAVPDAEVSEEDGVGGYEIPEFLIPTNHKALQQQEALRSSSGGGDNRISRPFNFKHETHVKVSKSASTGFEGLPDEWRKLLKDSGITKEETLNNPQIVLDVLEFRAGACSRPPPLGTKTSWLLRSVRAPLRWQTLGLASQGSTRWPRGRRGSCTRGLTCRRSVR